MIRWNLMMSLRPHSGVRLLPEAYSVNSLARPSKLPLDPDLLRVLE